MNSDNTTDKFLLVGLVVAVLIAAVYTESATLMDTFKIGFGATIYAIASRVVRSEVMTSLKDVIASLGASK